MKNTVISGHNHQHKKPVSAFLFPLLVLNQGSPLRETNLVLAVTVPGVGLISQSRKPFSK